MSLAFATLARLTLVCLCGAILAGCGKGADNQAGAPQGQVVAHVGDEVITIAELENELRLVNIPVDKQKDPETLKRIFTDLVARKYLYHQAVLAKVDREPNVLLDLLRAREGVLATAVISRNVAAKTSGINQAAVDKYISANPSKFAGRKVFAVEQISFPVGANLQSIVDETREKKSLDEVDQQLTAMNVPHNRAGGAIASSDLPESLVSQMSARKADEVFFFQNAQNGIFLAVRGEQPRPLDGEPAQNFARQALRGELVKSELQTASVAANLETKYEGDYARIMEQANPSSAK